MSRLSRNVTLDCGHDEALATLARNELSAWCPVCEARVKVTRIIDLDPLCLLCGHVMSKHAATHTDRPLCLSCPGGWCQKGAVLNP